MRPIFSLAVLGLLSVAQAQSLKFEVATIKPGSATGPIGGSCHSTDSTFNGVFGTPPELGTCLMRRVTLKMLALEAYGISGPNSEESITGGPGWVNSEPFDLTAKASAPAPLAQMRLMLQALLAERFGLVLHKQQKEQAGFTLVPTKGGPKLTASTNTSAPVGLRRMNGGPLVGENASMKELAQTLSIVLARPVADQTGLSDRYKFTLSWTPDSNERNFRAMLPPEVRAKLPEQPAGDGSSIFTAIQEQLGLRLDSGKVASEILVIDRATKPSEN